MGNKLSRVDSCVDLPGAAMAEFIEPYQRDDFVCRASRDGSNREHREINGFTIGKEPLCRIYEKVKEMQEHSDHAKLTTLLKVRWNNSMPAEAPRVEWQIRRHTIKELGVDGVEDWFAKRSGILRYLFTCLRFVDTGGQPFDRKHPERYATLPIWEAVERSFLAWSDSPIKFVVRIKPELGQAEPAVLRSMIGGCGLTLLAQDAEFWPGKNGLAEHINREVRVWLTTAQEERLEREWWKRRQAFKALALPVSSCVNQETQKGVVS
jgi:hypothetical protein